MIYGTEVYHLWSHAYHIAERLHLAYGFPVMIREIFHWLYRSHKLRGFFKWVR